MVDTRRIVQQWPLAASGVLVTLVRAQGSSYRRPGARMLVSADAAPAGTISGGCLESEVIRKAYWKVDRGARVETYSTLFDDTAEIPYGLGCGGVVDLLFESTATGEAAALHSAMQDALGGQTRRIVTWLPTASKPLRRAVFTPAGQLLFASPALNRAELATGWSAVRVELQSEDSDRTLQFGAEVDSPDPERPRSLLNDLFVEELAPPQRLILLGAGEDVRPVVSMAALLGWSTVVVDDRAQLARPERFPTAEQVLRAGPGARLGLQPQDAVVLMTHSYEQDRAWLKSLLALPLTAAAPTSPLALSTEVPTSEASDAAGSGRNDSAAASRPGYIGLLGARHRSALLVSEVAAALRLDIQECCDRIWAPVGLDLGGDGPEAIALAVVAEVQCWITDRLARSRRLNAADVAEQIARGGASAYMQPPSCSARLL